MPKNFILTTIITATALSMALVSPAGATGGVSCTAINGPAAFDMVTGRVPVLAVLSATATDGTTTWSTQATGGQTAMTFGQGMTEPDRIAADFTDPNVVSIIVSLRVFLTSGNTDTYPGTLTLGSNAAIDVSCTIE